MSFIKTEYAVLENDELDPEFSLNVDGWHVAVDANSGEPIAAFLFEYDACEFVDMLNAE
jgi:hypothetical protein